MKRNAFTLIETLIIVAIIGLLFAIIVPAVGKTREEIREREREKINSPDYIPPRFNENEKQALEIIESVIYIRYPRSSIVYAVASRDRERDGLSSKSYGWGYGYMAIVPPNQVSQIEHLIINREIEY